LQELDTEAIPPTATVLPLRNVMRADEPRPPFSRDDILANAPAAEDGCFKVPAVL
jgi:aspartyl-tRNA(Asn)/glutamyl-tRNA(Gln) amidotransferase subunit C